MTERLLTASETRRQQRRSLLAHLTEAITALRARLPAPRILVQATHCTLTGREVIGKQEVVGIFGDYSVYYLRLHVY